MKRYSGIRQRGENSYEVNFRPFRGAKRITKNIQAISKQDAYLKRAEMITLALKETAPISENRTTTSFVEIWPILERNIQADGLAHKTLLGLRKVYHRLFIEFRATKYPNVTAPGQLSLPFFLEYKSYYGVEKGRAKGLRAETQRIKMIMHRLRKLRFVSEELMKDLREVKTPERRKKEYPEINATQIKAFFGRVKSERPDIYGAAYFMLRTGRRVEETTLMERNDISWDGFTPIKINIRAETTKMKRLAPLARLDQDLESHIRYYYQLSNKHQAPYLFLNQQNRKLDQKMITKYLGKLSEEMFKIRLTAHYFRHRFCTETCNAKLPLVDILAISGIKNISTLVENYCHSTTDGQAAVLERTKLC